MKHLRVRNWDKFQHYCKRTPPWIKVYRSLLDDYQFTSLPDAARSHLQSIWLLASQMEGRVPADAEWVARRISATEPVDLQQLIDAGFLVADDLLSSDASVVLAQCERSASISRVEKSRGEESRGVEANASTLVESKLSRSELSALVRVNGGNPVRAPDVVQQLQEFRSSARQGLSEEEASWVVVRLVFSYWASIMDHEGCLLDGKRATRIRQRYLESKDPSEMLYVVDGARKDDNIMGRRSDSNRRYDQISTLFRDREQVERLAAAGGYRPGAVHRMASKYLGLGKG